MKKSEIILSEINNLKKLQKRNKWRFWISSKEKKNIQNKLKSLQQEYKIENNKERNQRIFTKIFICLLFQIFPLATYSTYLEQKAVDIANNIMGLFLIIIIVELFFLWLFSKIKNTAHKSLNFTVIIISIISTFLIIFLSDISVVSPFGLVLIYFGMYVAVYIVLFIGLILRVFPFFPG